jgi:hypothetical protein
VTTMTTLALPSFTDGVRARPFQRRTRRGFGLLEVILVFAIVIGAAAIVFTVFSSANDAAAVDHDHAMATTIRGNVYSIFPAHWDASNGPAVENAFYAKAKLLGGAGFCDSDNNQVNGGCYSALNGQPLGLTEVDGGGAQAYGLAFGLVWDDLTPGQCTQLLSGGVASTGGQAVSLDAFTGSDPESESDVISFCQGASNGGFIDQMAIFYTPSGPYPYLTAP